MYTIQCNALWFQHFCRFNQRHPSPRDVITQPWKYLLPLSVPLLKDVWYLEIEYYHNENVPMSSFASFLDKSLLAKDFLRRLLIRNDSFVVVKYVMVSKKLEVSKAYNVYNVVLHE